MSDWIRRVAEATANEQMAFMETVLYPEQEERIRKHHEQIIREHAPSWKPKPDAPGWWLLYNPTFGNSHRRYITAEEVETWKDDSFYTCFGPIPEPPEKI